METHDLKRQDVPLYTIGALARLTGTSMQTIRNWERRYGFPRPVAAAKGSHRLYTAAEVSLARLLAARVAAGTPIRKAVAAIQAGYQTPARLAESLEQAVWRLDAPAAHRTLAEAAALLPADQVWRSVAAPVLRALGHHWANTGTGLAAEHLATDIVRGWMHAVLAALGDPATGPLVVVACGPGERHELGSLMLAVMLRERGRNAIYLGADTPLAALREALSLPALQTLILTATTPQAAEAAVETLAAVSAQIARGTGPLIGYGGPGFASMHYMAPQDRVVYVGSELDAAVTALSTDS